MKSEISELFREVKVKFLGFTSRANELNMVNMALFDLSLVKS